MGSNQYFVILSTELHMIEMSIQVALQRHRWLTANNSDRTSNFIPQWTIYQKIRKSNTVSEKSIRIWRYSHQMCKICFCKYTCQDRSSLLFKKSGFTICEISNVKVILPPLLKKHLILRTLQRYGYMESPIHWEEVSKVSWLKYLFECWWTEKTDCQKTYDQLSGSSYWWDLNFRPMLKGSWGFIPDLLFVIHCPKLLIPYNNTSLSVSIFASTNYKKSSYMFLVKTVLKTHDRIM